MPALTMANRAGPVLSGLLDVCSQAKPSSSQHARECTIRAHNANLVLALNNDQRRWRS
jgi:hypothetical protein